MELLLEFLQSERRRIPENKQKKGTSSFDFHSETIKIPKRSEINIEQMNNCWESKCHATVQTMLDHRGDKHQGSATPNIISHLKTRHSDEKPV